MGTVIKRVQAVLVVLMLAIFGFLGTQPAMATEAEPVPGTEQPSDPGTPTGPVVVPPIFEPSPSPAPVEPEITPSPVQSPAEPAPVAPPAVEPVAPPAIVPVAPSVPIEQAPVPVIPTDVGIPEYVVEAEVPADSTTSAPVEPTPTPTPTQVATKTAAPPVASAEIAGPLKAAVGPVADNNPIVQGLTVLVLILLGVAYFRALRSKGIRGPRLNGK